jgi:hypothetical protein
MNNKTTGLAILLSILIIGLFVQLLWKPMSYLEGITNPSENIYDTMSAQLVAVLNKEADTLSKQTPEIVNSFNASVSSFLTGIMESNVYQTLSTSNEDFTSIISMMKSFTPENASMLSQVLTTLIQFLTDLKAQVFTANSNIGSGDGIVSTTINSKRFSKKPLVIA